MKEGYKMIFVADIVRNEDSFEICHTSLISETVKILQKVNVSGKVYNGERYLLIYLFIYLFIYFLLKLRKVGRCLA